ncbi:MAG: c-type cytochrome [Melioribacteraceae bacterium]|nr:c-type cytochrome [Melioribacteraceae bacterium]MCF8355702.1 c-type cytochrome [Melioribacteraceae bacterium]MCF8394432.1 c-type cytochrome [Melioribacteraceae bacterium]MCF8418566.1 c-type cytochrome [Melioribacteraceae bacterium]
MKNKIKLFVLSFVLLLLSSSNIFAAGDAEAQLYAVMKWMIGITILLVLLVLWLALVYSEKNDLTGQIFLAPLVRFKNFMTKTTPIEDEEKILMAHEYDGIRELDNKIPPWFSILFYGTIVFGIIYMINFHIIGSGNVQAEEYQQEIQAAQLQREILIRTGAFINEETVKMETNDAALLSGKDIFMKNCAACHAQNGGGLVGPNLTDEYWINGGGIVNVFKVIKYGVPQKGMISWESQLSPKEIQEVASYILTLQGTNPSGGKPPEGEKWEEPNSEQSELDQS